MTDKVDASSDDGLLMLMLMLVDVLKWPSAHCSLDQWYKWAITSATNRLLSLSE